MHCCMTKEVPLKSKTNCLETLQSYQLMQQHTSRASAPTCRLITTIYLNNNAKCSVAFWRAPWMNQYIWLIHYVHTSSKSTHKQSNQRYNMITVQLVTYRRLQSVLHTLVKAVFWFLCTDCFKASDKIQFVTTRHHSKSASGQNSRMCLTLDQNKNISGNWLWCELANDYFT